MKFLQTLKKVFTQNIVLKIIAVVFAFAVAVLLGALAHIG